MNTTPLIFIEHSTLAIKEAANVKRCTKGLFLQPYEMNILQQIYIYRGVEASSVHTLFHIEQPDMKANSITNRLAKWLKYKLIKRKIDGGKNRLLRQYYYYIGQTGHELLKCISPYPMGSYNPKSFHIPRQHNEWGAIAMIEVHRLNREREEPLNIRFERGSHHDLIRARTSIKGWVVPDYILQFGSLLICIEYDMGTESIARITEKSEKYAMMLEPLQQEGYTLAVIYLSSRSSKGRRSVRRIHSMKAAHVSIYQKIKHIPIYAVDEQEAFLIIEKLCTGQYPLNEEDSVTVTSNTELLERINNRQVRALKSESVKLEDILLEKKDQFLFEPDFFFRSDRFFDYRARKTKVYYAGEYGSVRTYMFIRLANQIFAKTNEAIFMVDTRPIEVFITYPYLSNKQLMQEYIGNQPRIAIWLQAEEAVLHSLNELIEQTMAGDNSSGYPIQRLKCISAFKNVLEEEM